VDEDHNARLLIISRLDPIKRVDIAFKAVEQALVKYPHLQITAIDSGPQRIRFLPQSGVTFIPPVAYADMPALIQAHDIIIGQFGLGCLGMAELESMACGKPVITYFSYPEWYESPPPILNSQNADQAYSALSSLLENPGLRRHLAGQSRAWVERHHNYITIARQLANYYAK
jgi:glycosyltransferase involved in cell wall biosynthesis